MSETKPNLPLSGIRVLDLSRILAGPVCTQLLGDLGADVVKVERPSSGDDTRQWGPPFVEPGGPSAYFISCNRNKRSLALDLNHPASRDVLEGLIRQADALVENFLPDALDKFGLTPERLQQLNPRLVSCSVSAFGRSSSQSSVPGYDLMVQASSGLMAITGEPDGAPMKVGVAITDVVTGLYAAVSIVSGLLAHQRGQAGRAFDVALADCTLASLVNVAQSTLLTGKKPRRWGNAHPQIVPYEGFATSDGYLVLAIGADRQWQRFCAAIARDDLAHDPRFVTNPARVGHRDELVPLLQEIFAARTTDEWLELLAASDVPHTVVESLDKVVEQSQTVERAMVENVADVAKREYRILASPIHWQGETREPPAAPPDVGQHTADVLRDWLSYDDGQIAELRRSGAIG